MHIIKALSVHAGALVGGLLSCGLQTGAYRTAHQLGQVVAVHLQVVGRGRIGQWQDKGLGGLSVGIDVGEVRTGVDAVIAFAAQHEPISSKKTNI